VATAAGIWRENVQNRRPFFVGPEGEMYIGGGLVTLILIIIILILIF
jgi:hypothetical protein